MCFSASASFVASGGLAVIGIASLRIASRKQRAIAVIPLLFAIQQAFEGFQWLAIESGHASVVAAYGFIFFALLVWPAYIPLTVFAFDKKRRHILMWPLAIGLALAIYYFVLLIAEPMSVNVVDHSIYYRINKLFGEVTGTLYLIAVCGALLLSSQRAFRLFGVALFASVMVSAVFFVEAFASVWCFFAAILSALIYFYIRKQQKTPV